MFTRKQYEDLNDDQKAAIKAVSFRLLPEPSSEKLDEYTDEEWADDFELMGPANGCVPEAYIDDSGVMNPIMRKYRCIYGAALDLAKIKKKHSRVLDSAYCYVEPSCESSSHVVIHNGSYVYFSTDSKAWNVGFRTLADLANTVLTVYREILNNVEILENQP